MNYRDHVKSKLKQYKRSDIIITRHAKLRAEFRGIDIDEVIENIINPDRLIFAAKQKSSNPDEEKYDCYFGYSKTQAHRYILVFSGNKIIVPTVIKINRRWQRMVDKG